MTVHDQGRNRKRGRVVLILVAIIVVLAGLLVPPWIGISRYKSDITRLISGSLGRTVRLSSVQLRLLPWPGFILTDLTVAEDPAYGAEPVLHANTVTASIRIRSLWRGRMEISRISLDEASLNLVRASAGHWNLNSLLRTAAGNIGASPGVPPLPAARLPYLEATNSRVNIKDGVEKLPFSLLDTDLSFWQEDSGEWRLELRGQPARTDLSLEMGDTGTIRLQATMRRAAALQQMPIHVDLDWREAQMGQLASLITGSDPGWRGDFTGQLQMDGTPDEARVKTRLRAAGVHREEFAPAEALDFDANCNFLYHSTRRSVENLVCDSPLGKGLLHLTGQLAGDGTPPQLSLELDHVPVAAGLAALRTLRNGLASDLEAQGTVSGKLVFAQQVAMPVVAAQPQSAGAQPQSGGAQPQSAGAPVILSERSESKDLLHDPLGERMGDQLRSHKVKPVPQSPLTGSLTVEGFVLSGGGLTQPLQASRIVFLPATPNSVASPPALAGTVALAAGAATPLSITLRLALDGYRATVRGPASVKWALDLAHVASLAQAAALDNLAGDPVTLDLTALGQWQPGGELAANAVPPDTLTGNVILHNANWKADFLANHLVITQAILHLDSSQLLWDPVAFSYGQVKGTASLSVPAACAPPPCPAQFQLQFGDLDASSLEAAFLGAQEPNTLLSTVIARLHPAQPPSWPELEGTVSANSLAMGAVTLMTPTISLAIHSDHAEFTAVDAELLGGRAQASGSMQWSDTSRAKPSYSLEAKFVQLSPQDVGRLLGESWSGGAINADGKLDLSGLSGTDLANSANGTLHFDWRHGAIAGAAAETETAATAELRASAHSIAKVPLPQELARFDDWTADAVIAGGAIKLGKNQVVTGAKKQAVDASLTFGPPPKVHFAAPKGKTTAKN